jgi:DNA-binding MarR family transcriptional regulator
MARSNRRSNDAIDAFLCFVVYSTNLAFNRVYKPLLNDLGLTYPQYLLMVLLWMEGPQTVGTIGDRLFLESSTLTPLIKRLEAMGLVTRRRDSRDERVVVVDLTPAGQALKEKGGAVPEQLGEILKLCPTQVSELRESLIGLRDHLRADAL